jgi:serine/threonine protein kinase
MLRFSLGSVNVVERVVSREARAARARSRGVPVSMGLMISLLGQSTCPKLILVAETLITDRRSATGQYKILRRLGKGGMAEVFLARQEGLAGFRRLTVLKKLLPQFSQSSDVSEMLLDEARIAAQLCHPNIVQIYELGKDEGQYYISMEFVDGCDVATLARIERHRESRVPIRLALRILSEAAMGLDYAHRQTGLDGRPLNIVHRDVSPHNIICSREGAVKLTDFGIAKAVGKALVTQVGVIKGKVQYMAPEQYTGSPVDLRSDIFSLGVILYQLTTGRLPRVGEDGEVVIRRMLEGKFPRPTEIRPEYPEDLETIVMRAMAYNPENRYPDAAAFRDDLLDFARENDLLAFPKELGDYVNAQVPPIPTVVKEQSQIVASVIEAESSRTRSSSYRRKNLPAVIVEGEDAETSPPHTEVASPHGRRKETRQSAGGEPQRPRADGLGSRSGPRAPLPNRSLSEPALMPDEALTPMSRVERPVRQPLSEDGLLKSAHPVSRRKDPAPKEALPQDKLPRAERPLAEPPPNEPLEAETGLFHRTRSARHGWSQEAFESPADGRPVRPRTPARDLRETPRPSDGDAPPTAPGSPLVPTPTGPGRPQSTGAWIVAGALMIAAGIVTWALSSRPHQPALKDEPKTATGSSAPVAGVINVLSNPPNASVSIDGAQRCPSTPCQLAGLPLGRDLLLTLRSSGYTLWMQRIVLTPSEPKLLLRADLAPLSRPADARAAKPEADPGSGTAKRGSASPHGKRVATHKEDLKATTKGESKVTVSAVEGDVALIAADVRPWAEVWVDGKKIGHTPIQVQVPPGLHKVELRNPDLKFAKTFPVKAAKGKKVKILQTLQTPSPPGGG